MWGGRYWGQRYFGQRYWGKVGSALLSPPSLWIFNGTISLLRQIGATVSLLRQQVGSISIRKDY